MTTLAVALAALNNDVNRWSAASEDLDTGSSNAWALHAVGGVMPVNVPVDLQTMYNDLTIKVFNLLRAGSGEARDIADELVRARTVLEGTDEAAKQALESLWDYDG
jgi:hypothetical protein